MRFAFYLFLFSFIALSHGACDPPEHKDVFISSIWQEKTGGYVQLHEATKELAPGSYPLTLSASPIKGGDPLPKGPTHTIRADQANLRLPLKVFASEMAIVLRNAKGRIIDQSLFVGLPLEAVLVRSKEKEEFCEKALWLSQSKCKLIERPTPVHRLRHIRNSKEFASLTKSYGVMGLQTLVVKFVVDLERDEVVHFWNANFWTLHYSFVRENIEGKRKLDTCKEEDLNEYREGYNEYLRKNWLRTEGRRFLGGSVMHYPSSGLYAVEFMSGDRISPQQMLLAYRRVRAAVDPRMSIPIRPVSEEQRQSLQGLGDQIPQLMPMGAPYQGEKVQLLSPGLAFGTLRAFSNAELTTATLGLHTIALLKEVPNDLNFVGGIISTHFQSQLSHINVLSRNRGTPHLVLREGVEHKDVKALLGKLVRLEVHSQGYKLSKASLQEAEAFWKKKKGERKPFTPSLDISKTDLIDLKDATVKDSRFIGAKAANLAELARVDILAVRDIPACARLAHYGRVQTPATPFAIPFYWYIDHLKRNGLQTKLASLHQDKRFRTDSAYRRDQLKGIRESIETGTINQKLVDILKAKISKHFGTSKVRFRSSTNVEDLPNFNGAGLYLSKSVQLGHKTKTIERGLRQVWASLWYERGWNEREFFKVDHLKSAMAILVHPAFPNEAANGVAVSTDIFRSDGSTFSSYVAVQKGEVSIVNPTTNVIPDQFIIAWMDEPQLIFLSQSSLQKEGHVLTREESILVGCYIRATRRHFQPLLARQGKPFAMEAEFKINGTKRSLILKQARPYILGEDRTPRPDKCK